MILLQLAMASAGTATLHVAVHREAGSIYDLAADGADGQCAVLGTSWIACPASEPVTFRWGPRNGWTLQGDVTVAAGETGVAFVLPPDGARQAERERLEAGVTPEVVREVFLRTGDRVIQPVTMALFADLVALSDHPDWRVRKEVVRALVPYARHTASDPFPSDAPTLIPAGLIAKLGQDDDKRVRRRTGALLREMGPEDPRAKEARLVLNQMLVDPNPGVQRVAVAVVSHQAMEGGDTEALEAWNAALKRVPMEGPPGRAACNGLAKLHDSVDPANVDPDGALALILQHHPERAWHYWGAWREELPFDPARAERLIRDTVGLSESLLRKWSETDPEGLARVVERWEPASPHSERFRVIGEWLDRRTDHPELRKALALADRLSEPSEGSVPE
ncbi:MAG: hypothetical protein R3F61_35150 [Myxococcota bacterium]